MNSDKGAIGSAIHEIIHFVWFYVWNQTFADSYEEYETPSLKWILSEMIVESVMKDPRLSSINPYFERDQGGCIYPYFFDMKVEVMDIKNLITFIHVAELGSFTKTAEILGFSQSTVSFQIKQLENELNSQLFERINHTVVLTEKGREVLGFAHQMNKLTQELKENIQNDKIIKGHIRLGMADSLCKSMLRKGFGEFRENYPELMLKIIPAGTEEMLRLLNHNEVDAILTLDNHTYNKEYVIAAEEKVGTHFVAGRDCPLSKKENISVQELLTYPFILTEKGMSYRRLMEERLAERSLEVEPVLEIGSTDLICQLICQGPEISFLPDYATKQAVEEGKLVYLSVDGFQIEVWKQLLYHRNKWLSPQLEAALDYCIRREFS